MAAIHCPVARYLLACLAGCALSNRTAMPSRDADDGQSHEQAEPRDHRRPKAVRGPRGIDGDEYTPDLLVNAQFRPSLMFGLWSVSPSCPWGTSTLVARRGHRDRRRSGFAGAISLPLRPDHPEAARATHTTSNRSQAFNHSKDLVRSRSGLRIGHVCLVLLRESWAWQTGLAPQWLPANTSASIPGPLPGSMTSPPPARPRGKPPHVP